MGGRGGRGVVNVPVRAAVFVGFGEGAGIEAWRREGAGCACEEDEGEGEVLDGGGHCGLW